MLTVLGGGMIIFTTGSTVSIDSESVFQITALSGCSLVSSASAILTMSGDSSVFMIDNAALDVSGYPLSVDAGTFFFDSYSVLNCPTEGDKFSIVGNANVVVGTSALINLNGNFEVGN
jgi:hypothetical protein